jgi:adenine-specific DNA-methyltransferase
MNINILKPRKSLKKAFLKVKPRRFEIERFKTNLIQLLDRINEAESEEFHKNLVIDFLKKTYYEPNHFINTKGRTDLVIHNGDRASSSVGVIIETKKPANRSEMITTSNLNSKAFHELVFYYLKERIIGKNHEVKHLIITNINEWFIFDVTTFDRLFAQNKHFVNQFNDFQRGRLADTRTDFFYKQIAEPFIANLQTVIEFTHFNIQDYQSPLRNSSKADDNKLIALFKILSSEHLLKLPFINDSNSLDKCFYSELLHIIGLNEIKKKSKKLIERNKEEERNSGSILEDTIIQLDSLDKIYRLERPEQYGKTKEERLFNIALELTITWINRILFLKLLEAQLITYNKGDESYSFLKIKRIKNYDDLNNLFFQVLAKKYDERNADVRRIFEKIPYLNSSLFEMTELEHLCFPITQLNNNSEMPIYKQTVLKTDTGKKRRGIIPTLEYLFEFLSAYDFSSEGSEEIQEENKTLINASVLGLIFEKINGYKDGSFFTPGFITMYMSRETIRKAVVQKFNEAKNWNCENLKDLYDKIDNRDEANEIVNNLRICDPAVGSGHFLVSALNEILAVKNDLKILQDRQGRRLKEYQVEVENDELIVTDEEGELFEYKPNNKESQRVQEALFHEKQTIIENCLFGVDINPNSVKICRLRLWIELLKNAYYKNETELETLPNIDINIKTGNSLMSRFSLDSDIKEALRNSTWTIDGYRVAVSTYRNAQNREHKKDMLRIIDDIKKDFRMECTLNDPKKMKLRNLGGNLYSLTKQKRIFEFTSQEKKEWENKVKKISNEIEKLEKEIEELDKSKIFDNAFEWRFEFPEVLNDDGDFVGFDVVIGNPPYFIMTKNNMEILELGYYINSYQTIKNASSKNIFNLFIELGILISNNNSFNSMIVPEGLFETRSYSDTIELFEKSGSVLNITRIEGMIFDEANTGNVVFIFAKDKSNESTTQKIFKKNKDLVDFNKIENPIISKIDNPETSRLSDICQLFKGMVVANRKSKIFEKSSENLPDKFLLGNCISKWKIEKFYYTDYENISIIGGTKVKEKHDVAPRIVIRRTGDFLCCAYLTEPALTESTLYSCWSIKKEIHNLFILGVLHSKVADYYIKNKFITNPQAFPQILMTNLQSLPIPIPNGEIHNSLKKLTEERLKYSNDNRGLESEIDEYVYKLYDLTEEEIQIIEDSSK